MILSAHQCNFFPYEGVLDKIRQSDVFVALGYIQFTRGNYHNRFHVGDDWYTMSVNQKLEHLVFKFYSRPKEDWLGIKRKLSMYRMVLDEFDEDIEEGAGSLVETNFRILERICRKLGITTKIVRDAPLQADSASERLAKLCERHGCTKYLSGPSGLKYLDIAPFTQRDVWVSFQEAGGGRPAVDLLSEVS